MQTTLKIFLLFFIGVMVLSQNASAFLPLQPNSIFLPSVCSFSNGTVSLNCKGVQDTIRFSHGKHLIINTINSNNTVWMDANVSASGTNLGTHGLGIYSSNKDPQTLQFLKILCGSGLNCSTNSTNVIMSATASGNGSMTVSNLAGSFNWFSSIVGNNIQLRGLNLGTGLSGSQNANTVTLSETLGSINFTSPANQTGTASTTPVMYGGFATITPQVTGRLEVTVSGYAQDSLLGDGCRIDVRESTSNMGSNGAVLSGTLLGNNLKLTSGTASGTLPFSKTVQITGVTLATKYYFDLSFAAITGGTCTINNVDWSIKEI